MVKVKYLTHLSKKIEERREFWPRLQKKSSFARFFLQPSVKFWLDFSQNYILYQMSVISGR